MFWIKGLHFKWNHNWNDEQNSQKQPFYFTEKKVWIPWEPTYSNAWQCPVLHTELYLHYDSPWYTAQVPGLQFVNDLRLQHHRLPRSYFLPQQIPHSGGELWLGLNDLRGLLVHHKRAEGEERFMFSKCTFLNSSLIKKDWRKRRGCTFESEPAEVAPAVPVVLGLVPQLASIPASAFHSPQAAAHT